MEFKYFFFYDLIFLLTYTYERGFNLILWKFNLYFINKNFKCFGLGWLIYIMDNA